MGDRNAEAHLGAKHDLVGDDSAECFFEDIFLLFRPLSLRLNGIRAESSRSSWSKNGDRPSRATVMVAISTLVKRSSGR